MDNDSNSIEEEEEEAEDMDDNYTSHTHFENAGL